MAQLSICPATAILQLAKLTSRITKQTIWVINILPLKPNIWLLLLIHLAPKLYVLRGAWLVELLCRVLCRIGCAREANLYGG